MPYVFVEEVGEGQEEADVMERGEAQEQLDAMTAERDEARASLETMTAERDKLAVDLSAAKTKFADAFLTTPAKAKEEQASNIAKQSKVSFYSELFAERKSNAN